MSKAKFKLPKPQKNGQSGLTRVVYIKAALPTDDDESASSLLDAIDNLQCFGSAEVFAESFVSGTVTYDMLTSMDEFK